MHSAPARPLSVMIVEDDAWMRDALERACKWPASSISSVACASDGANAMRLIDDGLLPDVALVDLGLPDTPGTDVIRWVRLKSPATTCVVFTVHEERDVILRAIRAGAVGYLLKSAPIQVVLDGLAAAAAGGSPMTPSVARLVIDALQQSDSDAQDSTEKLSPRELEVLTLLGKGLTYARVAEVLGIGLGTVQGHVKRIYEKLEVNSKAEAATLAQRMGLL